MTPHHKLLLPTPKRLSFGVDENGHSVFVGLSETNLLIAGQPGSGKSVTLAAIYAQMAQLANVAIFNFDPKMVELGVWKERASFNSECEHCFTAALAAIYREMERRYYILKERTLKKVTPEMWDEFPQLVLVLDEMAKVVTDPDNPMLPPQKTLNYTYIRKLVAEGRAAGISVIFATQRPSATLIPTDLRNLIQQSIVHSMARETDTKMVLGDIDGTTAHELLPNQKGVGFLLNEGSRVPTKFRASWVLTDDERSNVLQSPDPVIRSIATDYPTIEEIVAATRHLRVPLPSIDEDPDVTEHRQFHELEDLRLAQLYGA